MNPLSDGVAGFLNALLPPPIAKKSAIDLDSLAEKGRELLWMEEQVEWAKKEAEGTSFHPSQLANPCMRFDVLRHLSRVDGSGIEIMPTTESFNYKLQRKFDVGHALHDMEQQKYFRLLKDKVIGRWRCSCCGTTIEKPQLTPKPCVNSIRVYGDPSGSSADRVKVCRNDGRWIYVEPRVVNEIWDIEGRTDLALFVPEYVGGNGIVLVDIKTVGEERWPSITEPVEKDVRQLQIYLWFWPAEAGILRYMAQGRADEPAKHWEVRREPKVEAWVKNYIETVKKLAQEGRWQVASPACTKRTQSRAQRCPAKKTCFPED